MFGMGFEDCSQVLANAGMKGHAVTHIEMGESQSFSGQSEGGTITGTVTAITVSVRTEQGTTFKVESTVLTHQRETNERGMSRDLPDDYSFLEAALRRSSRYAVVQRGALFLTLTEGARNGHRNPTIATA